MNQSRLTASRLRSLDQSDEPARCRPFVAIPHDVLLEIAQRVSSLGVLLDISLMSRSTYSLLLPMLYSNVQLDSNDQCRATLSYLAREPDVAMFVKKLVVRPNHRDWYSTAHQEEQNETWIADLVSIIAAQGKFQLLEAFHWEGMEVPEDKLWVTLRSCCSRLRDIGCCVGVSPVPRDSQVDGFPTVPPAAWLKHVWQLFRFTDLVAFSLTSHTCNFRHHRTFHQVTPEGSYLPDPLWSMLLDRCPNLEALALNGRQDHLWRISKVAEGRWPRLQKLSLGHYPGGINNHLPFREFLSAHPLLRDITFTGLRFEPWVTSESITPIDFPAIESYTGFWPIHRSTIAYPMYKSIRSMTAYHVMWIPSSWMMTSVFPILKKKLPSLTTLSMSVEFRSRVGVTTLDFFRSLFASCPSLSHLELLSSSHVDLKDFSTALRDAPALKTFTLVKVPNDNDEDMTESAMRLVRSKPSLSSFTITHVCPWRRSEEYFIKRKGVYEVLPGKDGHPSAIFVTETSPKDTRHHVRRFRLEF